jgi:glycosyltransferase involved in cell wall biosynthesis
MRILYAAIDQTVPGTLGGSTHVQAVAEGLAALGHEVHVATQAGEGGFPVGSVHWHAVGAPIGRPHLRLLRTARLRQLARDTRAEIVIERYHNFGGEGVLAARHAGVPAVLEVNAPIVDYAGSPKARLDRMLLVEPMRRWREWVCGRAALIVTPTRAIVPPALPAHRIVELEWGADTARFRPGASGAPPFTRADGALIAVFAGAFRSWHGAIRLVDAMGELARRGTRWRAVLIGDGPELPAVRARAAALGIGAVQIVGRIPHADMPAALAAADLGVAPFDVAAHAPLRETFYWSPLKIFEYMASGLPVAAPDLPRLRALLGGGEAGVLYDPTRPAGLADAIASLDGDEPRRRLGIAARARAERLYSWEAHCRALAAAMAPLVGQGFDAAGGIAAHGSRGERHGSKDDGRAAQDG